MDRYLQHVTQKKPHSVVFSQRAWQPALDIYEIEDAVVATVDLSGVAESDIDLVVTRTSLTVRGERRAHGGGDERRYSVLEIPFGPFERSVELPAPVNTDATTATYRSGFLEITMPKLTSVGPQHVAVQVG
jgi:HSP20 family protein